MEQDNNNDQTLQRLLIEVELMVSKNIEALKALLADIMKLIRLQKRAHKRLQNKKERLLKSLSEVDNNVKEKPIEDGKRQSVLASKLLPKEMWAEVFSYNLGNGMDTLNTNRVCSTFHDILNPRKTTWLFGEIIGVLANHLETADLLLCRKVCKKWKLDVDNFIEFEDLDADGHRPKRFNLCRWTRLENDGSFTEQVTQDLLNSGSPFNMKALVLKETYNGLNDTQFWHGIRTLLDQFGKRVFNFSLESQLLTVFQLPDAMCSPEDLLRREILHLLPNLYFLEINGEQVHNYVSKYRSYEMMELPELKNLFELRIKAEDDQKVLVKSIFSKYSKQLRFLSLPPIEARSTSAFLIASKFEWPKLTVLEMGWVEMDFISSSNLEPFKNLVGLRLLLDYNLFNGSDHHFLEDVILFVNQVAKVAPKFSQLKLELQKGFDWKEIVNLPITLYASEKLKSLEVNIQSMEAFRKEEKNHFAFLLRFPFIRNLVIGGLRPPQLQQRQLNNANYYETIRDEIVQVYSFILQGRSMNCSNIWKLIPNLQNLTAFGKKYERFSG